MPQDALHHHHKGSSSKTEETIARLKQLLNATPSAEELRRSWARSVSETVQRDGPRLQDLWRALDAGNCILSSSPSARGIPMWIVVGPFSTLEKEISRSLLAFLIGANVQGVLASRRHLAIAGSR